MEPSRRLGQQITDPTGIWLIEFWNRSLQKSWSTDGSAVGPGPTLTPDLARRDGTLTPSPGTDYVLAYNGVTLQAPEVGERFGGTILYQRGPAAAAESRLLPGRGVRGRLDGPGTARQPLHGPGRRPRQRADRSLACGPLHDRPPSREA